MFRHDVDETYRVLPSECAATVYCRVEDLESDLSAAGFQWNPLSMFHHTRTGNRTNGSWVLRDSPVARRQLHVVLVRTGPERVDVYAHEEDNWLRHPIAHANGTHLNHPGGAARMRRILRGLDVESERLSLLRRKFEHAMCPLHRRLTGRSIP